VQVEKYIPKFLNCLRMKSLKLLQNIFFIGAFSLLVQTSWGQITGTINGVAITSNHVVCPYTDYTIVLSGAACYFNEGGDATIEKKNAGVYAPFNSPGYIDGTATLIIRFTGANARTLVVTEGNGGCNAKKVSSPLVTTFSFNVQPLAHPAFGSATVSGCTGNDLTLDGNAPASLTCTGTVCATLATYQWEQGGSPIPGATSPNYTIPQAVIDAITPAVTGQIVYTVNTTVIHGGGTITCYDEASVTVTRNDPPVLNAISLSAMPLQICANGTDVLSVECTSGCDAGATYTWQYKTIGAYADVPANVSSNLTTGTYINTLTLDGTSPALTPGLYDIQVIVENSVTKCATTSAEATNSVSINDLPGVEILHNYGAPDWTGATTSDNGVIICTGKELQLQPRGCDATNYSNDYTANQSSDLGPNVNQADDATAITYTSPCTGAGNDFFETLTWSATGSVTGALSIGGFPTLVINNPNATTNISTIYTNLQETITYTLLVEGVNGCTNTDNITIVSTAPDISFSYPASGMTTHSGGQTISGCEGTTVTIEGLCDLCNETPITSSWTQSIAGPNANGLPSSPSTSNPVTSETLTSTAANQYTLVMTDATGCTGSDVINVDDLPAPVITVAGTTPLCSGSPLRIDVTGFNAAYDYKVYDGDPNSGGALVWSCTTSCVPTNPLVTNINPVNGTDYYVVATLSTGTCADTASTGALAVTTTPSPYTINVAPASGICNYYSYPFYLGGGSSAYTYTWTISSNPVGSAVWTGAGTAPWLPGTPPEPSGTGFTTGGFFGPSPYGFTLGYSESITYAAVNLSVVVTNGACSANLAWPPFKIIDCQAPILQAATSYTPSGQSNHSNLALGQVGLTNDYDYVCEGGTIQLKADIGNSYYDPLYEWSSGETTESIYITTSSSTPDTVTRSVIVYKDNGGGTKDSISTLYHTFVVSRGGTNFNFYPDGVNSGAIDTSICRDESLFAQANCPTCRGSAFLYIWNASPPNTAEADLVTNSTPYQSYITLPATANFSVSLTFTHGESCREIIDRQIGVNALPTVTLREVSTGANITSATPLYLCDSDSIQLIAGCTAPCNAALSSFQWNTGATTPSINVATQGGYYALVTDQNECRKISEIGVVIDALDGLNSPVVANPSQICSGDDVVLEVAPCMGCSYQWIEIVWIYAYSVWAHSYH
jgi:hypothetical protein